MQRVPRLKKRRDWFITLLATTIIFIYISIAAFVKIIGPDIPIKLFAKLSTFLYSIPGVPAIVNLIPDGISPLRIRWELLILLAVLIPVAISAGQFHFHRKRFKDEERERDLKDI